MKDVRHSRSFGRIVSGWFIAAMTVAAMLLPAGCDLLSPPGAHTHTVMYNGNGNTGGSVPADSERYLPGAVVTVSGNSGSLVRTGYGFAGWNTSADGSGTDHVAGSTFPMGSVNVVLYAKWTALPVYMVTYIGNGNTGGSVPVDSAGYFTGANVTVLGNTGSLVRTGCSFAGWNTIADGSGADMAPGSTFAMGAAAVTLYAKWASESIAMVDVPGGSFQMGSPDGFGSPDEHPAHTVNITAFRMGICEVTQAQYESVTGVNPSYFTSGSAVASRPVETVTWFDAVDFCNRLSVRDGFRSAYAISERSPVSGYPVAAATVVVDMTANGYRLPTEAEWEYAARGGNGSPGGFIYSGSDDIGTVAWYWDNATITTHTVGGKAGNALGLRDMTGNVLEWCWDWYGGRYESATESDPLGGSWGDGRSSRGGSWQIAALCCQSTYRFHYLPGYRYNGLGFRLARHP